MKNKLAYFFRWLAWKLDPQTVVVFEKPPKAGECVVIVRSEVQEESKDYKVVEN